MAFGHKNGETWTNGTELESPEVNPHVYVQLISTRAPGIHTMGKRIEVCSINWDVGKTDNHMQNSSDTLNYSIDRNQPKSGLMT